MEEMERQKEPILEDEFFAEEAEENSDLWPGEEILITEETKCFLPKKEKKKEQIPEQKPRGLGKNILEIYLKDMRSYCRLSLEEEQELAKIIRKGGEQTEEAKEKFICSNLPLVVYIAQKMAKKYIGHSLILIDLIEAGNIGLIEAVRRFKPGKGSRFSTYAWYWITVSIERELCSHWEIPYNLFKQIGKVSRVETRLAAEKGIKADASAIARLSGLEVKKVIKVQELMRRKLISVNKEIDKDSSDDKLIDFVDEDKRLIIGEAKRGVVLFKDPAEINELRHTLNSALSQLSKKEEEVLRRRNAYREKNEKNREEPRKESLERIGKDFGLSRQRIKQIEDEGLNKIWDGKYKKALKEYYDST